MVTRIKDTISRAGSIEDDASAGPLDALKHGGIVPLLRGGNMGDSQGLSQVF